MFQQAQQLLYFQTVPSFNWPGKATLGIQTLKEAQTEDSLLGYLGSVMKCQQVSWNDPTELSSSFHHSSGSINNDPEETWRKPPLGALKFLILAQRHLQVLVPPSYLWFGASLENIQKLPAKSLKLREPNPGREEGVIMEKRKM